MFEYFTMLCSLFHSHDSETRACLQEARSYGALNIMDIPSGTEEEEESASETEEEDLFPGHDPLSPGPSRLKPSRSSSESLTSRVVPGGLGFTVTHRRERIPTDEYVSPEEVEDPDAAITPDDSLADAAERFDNVKRKSIRDIFPGASSGLQRFVDLCVSISLSLSLSVCVCVCVCEDWFCANCRMCLFVCMSVSAQCF